MSDDQGGSAKAWAVGRFDLVRSLGDVVTPGTALRWALFNRPTPVRFRNGFVLEGPAVTRRLATELALLGASGARFAAPGRGKPSDWIVDLPGGALTTPSGLRFALDSVQSVIFSETFLYDIHFEAFDLTGRTVVDAGANVGDTALYFASLGATVEAYEPDPATYALMLRNLALNPEVAARVHPHQEAVGEDGEITFRAGLRGGSGMYADGGQPVRVRSVSIATLLREVGQPRVFLLKCDCKGCEFQIAQQPAISAFDRVQVEYHTGLGVGSSVAALTQGLRAAGFDRMRVYKHNYGPYALDRHGVVHAARGPEPVEVPPPAGAPRLSADTGAWFTHGSSASN